MFDAHILPRWTLGPTVGKGLGQGDRASEYRSCRDSEDRKLCSVQPLWSWGMPGGNAHLNACGRRRASRVGRGVGLTQAPPCRRVRGRDLSPTCAAPTWLRGCAASLRRRGGCWGAQGPAPRTLRLLRGESRAEGGGSGARARGVRVRGPGSGSGDGQTPAWNLWVRGGGKI